MKLKQMSLIALLREYSDCDRAMEYGFDYETNKRKNKIIKELARRIKG
jgi:hypothetical protein